MTPPSSDAPTITFLTSNKKKRLLTIGGYTYQQNRTAEKVAYWICEEKDCWAGVHLDANDQFIKYTKVTHTHLPMPERVEIRKMITVVKRRVESETTAIGQVCEEELARTDLSGGILATVRTAKEASYCSSYCLEVYCINALS